jgi:hypothetical protein
MNWNDYEAVWKRQELPVGASADLATLRKTFEARRRKLHGALLVRDLSEAGAGLLVCIALGFIWRKIGLTGWPIGLAMALILGVSGIFVRERTRARKLRLGEDATLMAKIEADLAELRHQRHLLHTIVGWYLGPVFVSILIVHFTVALHTPPWAPQRDPVFGAGFVGFYVLCLWFIWLINRRAVRKQIEPRLEELEKLHRDLLGS